MSTPQGKVMMNPNDVVMLLIDHQSGLFNLVKDMSVSQLRNNVIALAKVAAMLKIPVITTASVPEGPNGPVIPEIQQFAPHVKYVPRQGQINAWDVPMFVKAVEETKRKTVVMNRYAHECLSSISGYMRSPGRLQGVCRCGCFRQLEQDGNRFN